MDGKNLFKDYSQKIKSTLSNPTADLKERLKGIVSYIKLNEREIKIALSGVNQKGLGSSVFASSPSEKQYTNIDLSLILDKVPLPTKLLLRSKSYLSNLYTGKNLPIREIARQLNVSHSTVIECLRRLGIHDKGARNSIRTQGQIPFGYNYRNGRLEKNQEEQEVIRIIKQLRSSRLSLRGIARELNKRLVPTKNNGIWHANTVSKILLRVGNQKMV